MKVIFWGTSEFALPFLETLHSNRRIDTVITTPDKPSGRGLKLTPPPVKREALVLGLNVLQPDNLKDPAFLNFLKEKFSHGIRVSILASYGKKIPKEIIEVFSPPGGYFLGIHPSLLPEYRGASPIQKAIMDSRKETGITIFQITEELDAGKIAVQEKVQIPDVITAGELEEILTRKGVVLIEDLLKRIEDAFQKGTSIPLAEQRGTPSYAPKISKDELWINWDESSSKIYRKINALSPKPAARTKMLINSRERLVKLLKARNFSGKIDYNLPSGSVLKEPLKHKKLVVKCAEGAVEILKLQTEGKREMITSQFLNGVREISTVKK